MRVSLRNLILLVTVAAFACIIAAQTIRSASRIASLESKLKLREVDLAHLILRQNYNAFASPEKSPTLICEAILLLWWNGELLIKNAESLTKIANNYRVYDEDPVIRARQLLAKIELDRQFVEKQIENLIAVADEPMLENLKVELVELQSNPQEMFVNIELSPKFESLKAFIRRLETAIDDKQRSTGTKIAQPHPQAFKD